MLLQKPLSSLSLIGCISLFLINQFSFGQDIQPSALRQIESLNAEKESRTMVQKKLDSQLWYALKMARGQAITPLVKTLDVSLEKNAAGNVHIELSANVGKSLLADLDKLGMQVTFSSERFRSISGFAPLLVVEKIAALDGVLAVKQWWKPMNNSWVPTAGIMEKPESVRQDKVNTIGESIREALSPETAGINSITAGAVTSEADVTHKAALARNVFNVNGSGVKIGVISDSYDAKALAASDVTAGELPGVGNPNGYTTPVTVLSEYATGTDEGRAMMQLVHDIAPGAQLYFATAFISKEGFAQAILDLRAAGCDIIVDDVSYFNEAVFQDDNIAQAVNAVTASGALYFSSAGNSGNKNDNTAGVWEGDFVDGGTNALIVTGGSLHSFGANPYNILTTKGSSVWLKWSDCIGKSSNDYDLYVINPSGTTVAGASTNIQDGDDNPLEVMGNGLNYRYVVFKKSSAAIRALHLNTMRGRLSVSTSGIVYGHNAGKNTISVAATPAPAAYPNFFSATNVVESFSSDGLRKIFYYPDSTAITPDNFLFASNGGTTLQKPDLTAADGTNTSVAGFIPFYGTSAAAPHAAAIAALVKSKMPGLNAAQIKAALNASAIDIETPGIDRDAGVGIIMAYEAIAAAGVLSIGSAVLSEGSFGNGNGFVEPGETAGLVVPFTNLTSAGATAINAVLSTSTPGINIYRNSAAYSNLSGMATGSNSSNPFLIAIANTVTCGTSISFTLVITYSGGYTSTQTFSIVKVIGPTCQTAPACTSVSLSPANLSANCASVGNPFSQTFTTAGGSGAVQYSITAGALPAGLSLSGNQLSGTPQTAGANSFTITATDLVCGTSVSTSYSLTVTPQISVSAVSSSACGGSALTVSALGGAGNALTFGGTRRVINSAFNTSPSVFPVLSASAWVNRSGSVSSFAAIVSNDDGGYDRALTVYADGTYHIFAGRDISTGIASTLNKWEFMTVTWSASSVILFKNGVQVFTTTGETITSSTFGTAIGLTAGSSSLPFPGSIDQVSVWSTARSAAQLQSEMSSIPSGSQSGLELLYKFDEGSGTTTADLSGKGRTGTLLNSPVWGVSTAPTGFTSYLWSPGGETSSVISVNPSSTTNYSVQVSNANGCGGISAITTVNVVQISGGLSSICVGENTAWNGNGTAVSWTSSNSGVATVLSFGPISLITGISPGTANITYTNNTGCSVTKQITINALPTIPVISGALSFCPGSSITLDAGTGYSSYLWSNGATTQSISVNIAGIFSVTVKNASNCSASSAWVTTSILALPASPIISGVLSFCSGTSTTLDAGAGYSSYLWSNGATTRTITVNTAGNFSVTVKNASNCSASSASVTTSILALPASPVISGVLSFCSGSSTTLDAGAGYSSYLWSNGETTRTITVNTAGNFSVTVKNASNCSASSASVTTSILALPASPVISGALSFCSGSSTTLDAGAGYSSYLWSNGETTQSIETFIPGTFSVTVTNANGCSASSAQSEVIEKTASVSAQSLTVCGSLLWNNILYTSSGTYFYQTTNAVGCDSTATLVLTILNKPAINSEFSGSNGVCRSKTGLVYSIPASAGATSYTWTLPTGMTGSSSSNIITVATSSTFAGGNIQVVANNSCGSSPVAQLALTALTALPAAPASITGQTTVCAGYTLDFTCAEVVGATYNWTVPANANIISGQGTRAILVGFNDAYITGAVSVKSTTCFGTSTLARSLTVAKKAIPATPGVISGPNGFCVPSTQTYSIVAVSNATDYTWTAPANASIVSQSGTSVTVAFGEAYTTGNLSVTASNCSGTSAFRILALTKKALPGTPGVITGITTGACSAQRRTYTIVALANTDSYEWTAPANASIYSGQGSTSVVVEFAAGFTTGTLSVKGVNCSGTSVTARTLALSNATAAPTVLTGPATAVCAGSTQTYSTTAVANATTYTWAVPSGAIINSGQGNTSISVTFPSPFTSGAVTVKSGTACYSSAAKSLTVYSVPVAPASITGNTIGVCGGSTQTYTCPVSTTGAISYNWVVPAGATINSGQGGNSISVTLPTIFATGNVSVTSSNSCGTSTVRTLAIRSTLTTPGVISGQSTNLCGGGRYTYTIVAVTGASSYNWTIPPACTMVENLGTSITLDVPATGFTSGTLSVSAQNTCGTGALRSLTLSALPATPASVSGPASVCPSATGLVYSTPVVSGVTNYTWTVPTGASITAGQNTSSITANWGTVAGSVTVKAGNACGTNATAKALAVTLSVACREVVSEEVETIHLYPNPANQMAKLNFGSAKKSSYTLQIINSMGQSVYSSEGNASEGANTIELNLENLSSGLYIVQLVQDGSRQQVSLVKK